LDDRALSQLVIGFVIAQLRTIDDLHLLVAMSGAQDRWFDADRVARELGIGKQPARSALEHLASRNLLEIRVTGDVRYQFNPGTPHLRDAAYACVDAYRKSPMALWRLASEQLDHRSLRDFADAFKIRRDDDR
jgi:hypothetical protein